MTLIIKDKSIQIIKELDMEYIQNKMVISTLEIEIKI